MTDPTPMFLDFHKWTDRYQLVQDAPGRTSGNGALYHADFIACCESYHDIPPQWAYNSILTLEDPDNPGLLFRVPGERHAYGHEGPDNSTEGECVMTRSHRQLSWIQGQRKPSWR